MVSAVDARKPVAAPRAAVRFKVRATGRGRGRTRPGRSAPVPGRIVTVADAFRAFILGAKSVGPSISPTLSMRRFMSAHPPRTIVIDSWEDFQRLVAGSHRSWAFRGQLDAQWPLFSSLSRYLQSFGIHRDAWSIQESRILRIFRRKSHHFLARVPDEEATFEWLALMQHHGAPTRLLDFTWSPYVAAFFALERAVSDAAIWAIYPSKISHRSRQVIRNGVEIEPQSLGPWVTGNYEKYFLPGNLPMVIIGEPQMMNRRLIAQSGTFAMPGVLDEPLESILADYPSPEEVIVKYVLKTEAMRERAMFELYKMNVTNATLFPDLDGLARSLAYELESHWAFDTRKMELVPGFDWENVW